jgi:hypothetical protein
MITFAPPASWLTAFGSIWATPESTSDAGDPTGAEALYGRVRSLPVGNGDCQASITLRQRSQTIRPSNRFGQPVPLVSEGKVVHELLG